MFNPNEEGPISPMKKLKILGEKQVNVIQPKENPLEPIKEKLVEPLARKEETERTESTITEQEPLLQERPGQYVIFPINHEDMWHMYKELVNNFWSFTDNLDLDKLQLNYNEKKFMKLYSSIFASSESKGLVNDNFAEDFCRLIQVTEAKFFYGHQLFVQNIHYEMYNRLLDCFVDDATEKEKLFKTVESYNSVANKRAWINQWQNSSFGEQLMAATCLHGLLFCSLSLVCNWLKARNKNKFNHEIIELFDRMIVDQDLQRDFSCLMIGHLKSKPSIERILETINDAAKIEFDFILNGLNIDLIEIEPEEVIQLIDRKTKELKNSIIGYYDNGKKLSTQSDNQSYSDNKVNEPNEEKQSKENHQKITFDEDF
jgi:ribonucleotide reductase beta subunit family protein with ferritin-like domain